MNAASQRSSPLGEFLSRRRAMVTPAELGLPTYGDRRRVPGLRREEVAQLAGVSVPYYIRLEQGSSLNASPQVLDALATALGLDETERRHLHSLSGSGRLRTRRRPASEQITPAMRQLMDAFGDAPAILLGQRSDVLAWNPTGHALFAGHLAPDSPHRPGTRPNTARLVFLDAHTRELYGGDWPRKARDAVGKLRLAVGEHPEDPQLASLIGELTMASPQFAAMWAEHRVRAWDLAEYRMRHPLVGTLDVLQHSLPVPRTQGIRLVVVTAGAGSASQHALHLLAHTTHATRDLGPTRSEGPADRTTPVTGVTSAQEPPTR
jgi:transcriptional regulator with XRE-family HTH domain